MWFDMDGACWGNVDLSIRSEETLPESQSLAHLMHYQILINLDNFEDASMKGRSDGDPKLADPITVFCARRDRLAVDADVGRTED